MKHFEVIEKILNYHPKFPEDYNGCDNYKCGNPEDECMGIVTALAASVDVIKKAIELNANLIIVHEPTFYTSIDAGGWYEDFNNSVYEEKRKLLDDHHITIWRDHDHMHAHNPDSIFTGVLKYMGFDSFRLDTNTKGFPHYIIDFKPMKLKELCDYYIEKTGVNGIRYIGDPEAIVSSLALVGHLYPMGGEAEYSVNVIKTLEEDVDVIVPGETIDWTVLSYVRDAIQLGKNKAVINLGHFNGEEFGMKYYKEWLDVLLENKVNVTYVKTDDMYRYEL